MGLRFKPRGSFCSLTLCLDLLVYQPYSPGKIEKRDVSQAIFRQHTIVQHGAIGIHVNEDRTFTTSSNGVW